MFAGCGGMSSRVPFEEYPFDTHIHTRTRTHTHKHTHTHTHRYSPGGGTSSRVSCEKCCPDFVDRLQQRTHILISERYLSLLIILWRTCSCVIAYVFMRHQTCVHRVMAQIFIESWHTYSSVMASEFMSHSTHERSNIDNESRHTYSSSLMARVYISHGTHMHES